MDTLIYLAAFLVTILILVTVHEFGHYWVARRCGVRVLRFSIGFGNPLFRWVDKHGTEWSVAPIPLGGYVKMFGESREDGDALPIEQQHESFAHKSVGQRMAIVAAGPLINFLLALVVFWGLAMAGIADRVNQVASIVPGSLAEQSGLVMGDTITAVDGVTVNAWSEVAAGLGEAVIERRDLPLSVARESGERVDVTLGLSCLPAYAEINDLFYTVGLEGGVPLPELPLVIGRVMSEPAQSAGLRSGDKILSLAGHDLASRADWDVVAEGRAEQMVDLVWQRDGRTMQAAIQLGSHAKRPGRGMLGVAFESPSYSVSYNPLAAVPKAFVLSYDGFERIVSGISKMVTGQVSIRHVGGPIQIAEVAGERAKIGWKSYLSFLALLSIMLGIMNLLPVPVLDGGHLLYYAIEWVRGKPLSERVQAIGLRIGLVLIVALMVLAFANDFMRVGERIAQPSDKEPVHLCT